MAESSAPEDEPHTPPDRMAAIGGRYEVVRELGRGASGRTLLCDDLNTGQRVAVKELRLGLLDSWKHLELFEREARALSLLDHTAIPTVVDVHRDGEPSTAIYIVQEYVEGRSLRDRIDSGPMLGQEELAGIARQLLGVLDYLHGRAPPVLHRDIKPSNVMLRPDGTVALLDFGGVLLEWRSPDSEGATVVGTFGYMPPEQLVGQAGARSDLYALGATLLHALTGRPPTDFPFDSGRIEVPSDLPGSPLVNLVEALLRPAPRDRPESARRALELLTAHSTPRGPSTAVTQTHHLSRQVAVVQDNGPAYVNLGPPPRDPAGEFKDVYRNLMSPLFPSKRLWSLPMHVFWVGLSVTGAVTTIGLLPLLYARTVRTRIRRYKRLFQHGHCAEGVIRSAKARGVYATVKYEFAVDGVGYVAFMEYAAEMADFWNVGDRVPVLFDPADPKQSCFVYR